LLIIPLAMVAGLVLFLPLKRARPEALRVRILGVVWLGGGIVTFKVQNVGV
jgi:hypothetical protein